MSYPKPSTREHIPERHALFIEASPQDMVAELRRKVSRLEDQRNFLLATLTFVLLAFILHPFFFTGAALAFIYFTLTFLF